jgi:hypothetical protein
MQAEAIASNSDKLKIKWVLAGGSGSLFSFYLTAPIDERMQLLQSTGSLRNEGAPRLGFTRGSLYLTVTLDPVSG